MKPQPLVSIVISSYNYARFLPACIGSALDQTYPRKEIIVVDDGSRDESPSIARSYGSQVLAILKENGGQASAFNVGFELSHGELICFVDSDDTLLPSAIEEAVECFESDAAKVHWPLWIVDENGERTGRAMHKDDLAEGDLREVVASRGPAGYQWPSTSGNLWSRTFLERVMPVPEPEYRIGPDVYLSALAPLHGKIRKLNEPRGTYRIHSRNNTRQNLFEERVDSTLGFWDHAFATLRTECLARGLEPNLEAWKSCSWWHQTELAWREILQFAPKSSRVLLIGEDQWVTGETVADRRVVPFLEKDGEYWGAPADDERAIDEFENARCQTEFAVLPWWSFWWLDHFETFNRYLRATTRCILENERLIAFDLRTPSASSPVCSTAQSP